MSNPKLQAPNPNHFQFPRPNAVLGSRDWEWLGFGLWEWIGIWSLELGIYPVFRIPAATPLIVTSSALRN
jgi:hypothetical protein